MNFKKIADTSFNFALESLEFQNTHSISDIKLPWFQKGFKLSTFRQSPGRRLYLRFSLTLLSASMRLLRKLYIDSVSLKFLFLAFSMCPPETNVLNV